MNANETPATASKINGRPQTTYSSPTTTAFSLISQERNAKSIPQTSAPQATQAKTRAKTPTTFPFSTESFSVPKAKETKIPTTANPVTIKRVGFADKPSA